MIKHFPSLLLFFFILTEIYFTQYEFNPNKYKTVADTLVKTAMIEQKGYKILEELCKLGHRISGSENSLKAIFWAEKKMKELGLDKVWLQSCMVPTWNRGNIETAVIKNSKKNNNRKLNIAAFGGSIGTDLKNGISAEVIEVKSFQELKSIKDKVKGKIVFFNQKFDNSFVNSFAGYGKGVQFRAYGAIESAKFGAVAVIVRSVTSKNDNIPHTGVMYYNDTLPKIPSVGIGVLDADFLSNAIKEEPTLKINLKLSCKNLPDSKSYNVIGELTGTEKPNEVILIGGHFDCWDKGVGAHDDGGGCVQSLEVLDLFNRLNIKPKRTIRCVFFINEENGTAGGIEYGKYADTCKEIHISAIESDRGVFTPRGFYVDSDSSTLNKIKSWLPILEYADINWVKKGGSGVDVSKIKKAKSLIGFVPDSQRYMDVHHSANDVIEAVHPREFELGTSAIAILTFLLSEEGL